MSCAGIVASLATTRRTVDRSGHRTRGGWETKGNGKSKESSGKSIGKKGKGKSKSKSKGKRNSVEKWQEGLSATGAQGDEHADGGDLER